MRSAALFLGALGLTAVLAQACQGFPTVGQGKRLVVTVTQGDPGAADRRIPLSVVTAVPFTVDIEAQLPDGSTDTSFNGFVNVSVQPGTVADLNVRNVQLTGGLVKGVVVPTVAAFGDAHIWAEDIGYTPKAPNANPQCSDGIDNNNNGLIDYPADPGCYAPVDDTEDLGTYASGASETLFFQLPRIPLVRGFDPANNGNGNSTLFPNTQVSIDTGWRGGTSYAFSTVVIGLTSAGFYVQDLQSDQSPAPGYAGIYAYNFSTPPFMRVCDRLQQLSGTASDFYGFTELNYPTWQLEYWDPKVRPCLVPEPTGLNVCDLVNNNRLWQVEATLVRVERAGPVTVHVARHFGPGLVPENPPGTYTPGPGMSNCDYDHNGKINFSDTGAHPSENDCNVVCMGTSAAAPTDFECSEYSGFSSQNNFELVLEDATSGNNQCQGVVHARVQVNAAAANGFNPVANQGKDLRAFSGLVSYFSGGSQFTINARCDDDIATFDPNNPNDPNHQPKTSDQACVHPRTQSDINQNSQ